MLDREKFNKDMKMDNIDNELMEALKKGVSKGKKEEKAWYKKAWAKSVATIGLIASITIGGCVISPTFAESVSNLPIVKEIISLFKYEKNIQTAVDNDYGGSILAECSNEDYIFRIIHGMRDKNNLILFYELISKDEDNKSFLIKDITITDKNGKTISTKLQGLGIINNKGMVKIQMDEFIKIPKDKLSKIDSFNEISDSIYISARIMTSIRNDDTDNGFEHVEILKLENFEVAIGELDKSLEVVKEINKEIQVGDEKIEIQKLEIEPTEMRVNFNYKKFYEKAKFIDNVEVEFEDDKGKKWNKMNGDGIRSSMTMYTYSTIVDKDGIIIGTKDGKEYLEYDITKYLNTPYFFEFKEFYLTKLKIKYYDLTRDTTLDFIENKITNGYDKYFKIEDFTETDEHYKFSLVPITQQKIIVHDTISVGKIVVVDKKNSHLEINTLRKGYQIKPIYSSEKLRIEEEKLNKGRYINHYEKYEKLDITIDKNVFQEDILPNRIKLEVRGEEKFIEFNGKEKIFSKDESIGE